VIAHVGGVPVEELLPLVPAFAAGAGLVLAHSRTLIARARPRAWRRSDRKVGL
jgi:hypothetical protein